MNVFMHEYILVYSLTGLFYHLQSNFGVAPRYPFLEAVLLAIVAVVVSETVFAPTLSTAALNGVTVELVRRTATAILHQLLQLQFLRLLMYPFLFLNPQFLRLLIYPVSLIFQTMRMATVPVLTTL